MIIGLTGKKQHGKDTAASILVAKHGYRRLAFADALKQSAAALFDIDPAKWDDWKNDPDMVIEIIECHGYRDEDEVHAQLTVRQFLQRYGTEAHREVFGDSFWLDVIEKELRGENRPKIVVSDVRFDNEADLIRRYSGIVVEVCRPQVVDAADTHASEDLPRADLMLWNGEDIESLRQRIAQSVAGGWAEALL